MGAPDSVNAAQAQWLLVPGPPLSCYFGLFYAGTDLDKLTFFHKHPNTHSVHVVVSGRGHYNIEGRDHDVAPGSVIYVGPGVRHSVYPHPGEHLGQIVVQTPYTKVGEKDWMIDPEAGTTDQFGDLAAFAARFGGVNADKLMEHLRSSNVYTSPRWKHFIAGNLGEK
jgi:mannose-6-phosphate isomerase-like protein (cupin superfamily)